MSEETDRRMMFALCFIGGMLIMAVPMSYLEIGPYNNDVRLKRENIELRRINAELAEALANEKPCAELWQ